MKLLLVALALMQAPDGIAYPSAPVRQDVIAIGRATYYARGVMETVYRNRLAMGHVRPCARCVGFVSLVDCSQIGKLVYLRSRFGISGPFQSIDCAAPGDLAEVRRRGIVVEVSFEQGRAWEMAGPLDAEVLEAR